MKSMKIPIVISVVLLAGFAGLSFRKSTNEQSVPGSTTGFAVVELFTSEGCSSCPAADEALQTISTTYGDNVFLLGFHVDYWNRLGWKDVFSSAVYTERQRHYAQVFESDGVYTPQAIVNGSEQIVGSDLDKLNVSIKKGLKTLVNDLPVISVGGINGSRVEVSYTVKENKQAVLNIALVQLHTVSDVKNGENKGRSLSHINIVRDFKTVSADNSTGKISLVVPAGLKAADCKLIAYIQDKNSFKITGATTLPLK